MRCGWSSTEIVCLRLGLGGRGGFLEEGVLDLGRVVVCALSCIQLATPWTVAHQVPLSVGFSRQEC